MLDNDLKLLSALLGRPITIAEIPSLVGELGRGTAPTTISPPPKRSSGTRSTSTTTTTTTTEKSTSTSTSSEETTQEVNLESTPLISPDFYGKTNEAKIAAILRQQGIGPANNNIPVEVRKSNFLKTFSNLSNFFSEEEILKKFFLRVVLFFVCKFFFNKAVPNECQ